MKGVVLLGKESTQSGGNCLKLSVARTTSGELARRGRTVATLLVDLSGPGEAKLGEESAQTLN